MRNNLIGVQFKCEYSKNGCVTKPRELHWTCRSCYFTLCKDCLFEYNSKRLKNSAEFRKLTREELQKFNREQIFNRKFK